MGGIARIIKPATGLVLALILAQAQNVKSTAAILKKEEEKMIKETGGPAFPTQYDDEHGGMTLRDWYAGQESGAQFDMKPETVCKIRDIKMPPEDDAKAWFRFWMEWEAFRKFAYADAMIKAGKA